MPRNDVEERLVTLWERFLEVRPIGIRDDFFLRGGHSLAAARLLGELRKDLGLDLRLALFVRLATVERIGELLERQRGKGGQEDKDDKEEEASEREALVCLEQRGRECPIVAVHPEWDGLGAYGRLAGALGENRPFFALNPRGPSAPSAPSQGRPPRQDVPSMAAAYLHAVQRELGDAPFILVGWSAGGLVAAEMAQQMALSGSAPEKLVLLDTEADWSPVPGFVHGMNDVERCVFEANAKAARAYTPEAYEGPVLIVRAEATPPGDDGALGWSELLDDFCVETTPGDRRSMMEPPFVSSLAERLAQRLTGAE